MGLLEEFDMETQAREQRGVQQRLARLEKENAWLRTRLDKLESRVHQFSEDGFVVTEVLR